MISNQNGASPKRKQFPTGNSAFTVLLITGLLLATGLISLILAWPRPVAGPPSAIAPPPLDGKPPLPLVQASGGYTLTIQPFYADANSVVVSMTVQGVKLNPNEYPYLGWRDGDTTQLPRLADDARHDFPVLKTYPNIHNSDVFYQDLERCHEQFYLLVFDAAGLKTAATSLNLRLTVGFGVALFGGVLGQTGPLTFAFTLPYEPERRVTEVNQTVGDHKGSLTLERVTVSRHSVRAGWHFTMPDGGMTLYISPDHQEFYLPPEFSLHTGDWSSDTITPFFAAVGGTPDSWTSQLVAPLFDQTGDWRLQVKGGFIEPNGVGNHGQWIYHFTVPKVGEPPLVYTPVMIEISPTPLPTQPPTPTWAAPPLTVPPGPRPIPTVNLPSPIPSFAP